MGVTLRDVAARAGVSPSAVSRTFTAGASVSAATRAKVERAAAELGYLPSFLASGLSTGRTKLIGLISNNFSNPYFLEVFDHFTRALQDAGLRPLLVNLSEASEPARSVAMLRQYSVDGVIVASSTLPPGFAAAFREAGLPVIHTFGWSQAAPRTHLVGIDNVEGGRIAARTLIARGYRNIAFLGGPETASTTQDRLAGFRAVAAGSPGVTCSHSFARAYSFAAGEAEMARLLRAGPPAEAYFCGDDVIAIGALAAAQAAGLPVPGAVGILGFNDMAMAGWGNIALTTIRQPTAAIVAASVSLVQAAIAAPAAAPQTRLLPCALVERRSLRPLPG